MAIWDKIKTRLFGNSVKNDTVVSDEKNAEDKQESIISSSNVETEYKKIKKIIFIPAKLEHLVRIDINEGEKILVLRDERTRILSKTPIPFKELAETYLRKPVDSTKIAELKDKLSDFEEQASYAPKTHLILSPTKTDVLCHFAGQSLIVKSDDIVINGIENIEKRNNGYAVTLNKNCSAKRVGEVLNNLVRTGYFETNNPGVFEKKESQIATNFAEIVKIIEIWKLTQFSCERIEKRINEKRKESALARKKEREEREQRESLQNKFVFPKTTGHLVQIDRYGNLWLEGMDKKLPHVINAYSDSKNIIVTFDKNKMDMDTPKVIKEWMEKVRNRVSLSLSEASNLTPDVKPQTQGNALKK